MSANVHNERVLSTLNQDGSRHWIRPKLSRGRFLKHRRWVGYALILLFVLLPRVRIHGRPGLLIDLISREVVVFGSVFRPSDGFALALLGLSVAILVFLVTALWGRVWCGWGCPQTVYLEHVFRPVERLFEGSRGQNASIPRKIAKWIVFAGLAFALSNVFLAYFVGTERLEQWITHSPSEHPFGFGTVMFVSALMLFDFGWFREQMCIVTCPYGRLQSVLLDRQSLIVGYDVSRGEPRGKLHKKLPVVADQGDCVDCHACVATCPTGIDIRDGLQMECIGCAQCIDACDAVMDKLGRKRGLIRYTSQDELGGKPRKLLRGRTIVYPVVLAAAIGMLAWQVGKRVGTEVWIDRIQGPAFVELPDGRVSSQARIKIENQSDEARGYNLSLVESGDAQLRTQTVWEVKPRKSVTIPMFIDLPRTAFVHGEKRVFVRIDESTGFERIVTVTLLGPAEGSDR
jgi:cytochrome c oxidase accessory protein FixG